MKTKRNSKNMNKIKNIAVITSADRKTDLIEWSYFNRQILSTQNIFALGEATNILEGTLNVKINISEAGKLGEYAELCGLIENKMIDAVIIFNDTTEIFHNKGIASIIESANRNNIVLATNRTTADFVINSSLIDNEYKINKDEKKIVDSKSLSSARNFSLAKAS